MFRSIVGNPRVILIDSLFQKACGLKPMVCDDGLEVGFVGLILKRMKYFE